MQEPLGCRTALLLRFASCGFWECLADSVKVDQQGSVAGNIDIQTFAEKLLIDGTSCTGKAQSHAGRPPESADHGSGEAKSHRARAQLRVAVIFQFTMF